MQVRSNLLPIFESRDQWFSAGPKKHSIHFFHFYFPNIITFLSNKILYVLFFNGCFFFCSHCVPLNLSMIFCFQINILFFCLNLIWIRIWVTWWRYWWCCWLFCWFLAYWPCGCQIGICRLTMGCFNAHSARK